MTTGNKFPSFSLSPRSARELINALLDFLPANKTINYQVIETPLCTCWIICVRQNDNRGWGRSAPVECLRHVRSAFFASLSIRIELFELIAVKAVSDRNVCSPIWSTSEKLERSIEATWCTSCIFWKLFAHFVWSAKHSTTKHLTLEIVVRLSPDLSLNCTTLRWDSLGNVCRVKMFVVEIEQRTMQTCSSAAFDYHLKKQPLNSMINSLPNIEWLRRLVWFFLSFRITGD